MKKPVPDLRSLVVQRQGAKAVHSLRRLGAKVDPTNITASCLLRWCLSKAGYVLVKAGSGLIGLSNSLADNPTDAFRAIHTNSI